MFQALPEEKNDGNKKKTDESDQSLNSSFKGRKSLSMIQERDTETDTEMAPNTNRNLELEMSIETKVLPRNIIDDINSDSLSPASSIVETSPMTKLKSEPSSDHFNLSPYHDKRSVLNTVKNEIKDFFISNKVYSDSKVNFPSIELMVERTQTQTDIKSNKDSNITFKEHEIKRLPCKEVEIRISPVSTVEITTRDPRNMRPREPIREVKNKRSPELSMDNPLYKSKAETEITKGKCIEELYRAHYSSNTHSSIEDLYIAKCSSSDKRKINRKTRK